MKGILTALHVISVLATLLGAVGGGIQLSDTLSYATGAPQQAAGAAMAIAVCIVPYVIMRCFSTSLAAVEAADAEKLLKEQVALLRSIAERK